MGKITCNVIRDLMPLYVDEVLSKDTKELVEEHLEKCQECRKELEQMQKPVALPDFQKVQTKDTEVIKGLRSKLAKKRMMQAFISVLIVLTLVAGIILAFLFYGREQSFADILPSNPDSEITFASLSVPSTAEDIELSQEQIHQLFSLMDQMHYKKLQMASGMDSNVNYATLRYFSDGHLFEFMFSTSKGGCILVNDVEKDGKAPLYRMISGGTEIEKLLKELWIKK